MTRPLLVALAAIVAGCLTATSGCASRPAHLLPEDDLTDEAFELTDHTGAPFAFPADVAGRPALVTAVYTHCPDVCLMTMATLRRIRDGLGADTARVAFVTFTFDPARDTPDVLAAHAAVWRTGSGWRLATADTTTTGRLMRRLGIRTQISARDTLGDGTPTYSIAHTDKLLLVDADGRVVETYGGSSAPPDMVVADTRALLP